MKETTNLPYLLQQLLTGVLSGEPEKKSIVKSDTTDIANWSGSNICHNKRKAETSKKHFILPYAINTLTGDVLLN